MPDGLSGKEQAIYFSKVRKFFDSYACSRVMGRRKEMSEHLTDTNVGNIEYIRKADAIDMCGGYGDLAYMMSKIKPADVAPVVRGRWLPIVSYNNTYKCSECGRLLVDITDGLKMVAKHYPYCHCGAKMDAQGEG